MDRGLICIIGGGPSAADLDTSTLKPAFVIGVNDAAFHKPCDAFFSNDHKYALRTMRQIETYPGERHLSVKSRALHLFRNVRSTVTIWERLYSGCPTLKRGRLSSGGHNTPGCSGYVALNLAAQMEANRVILFGYDMDDDYRYFFSETPYPRIKVPQVRGSFDKVAPWYRERGIEILNANPDSRIGAFPKITHEEAYAIIASHQVAPLRSAVRAGSSQP